MKTNRAVISMIEFYDGSVHDVTHFLKVHAYARLIGESEGLDEKTLELTELAAICHDIACPYCREKYGNAGPKHQEQEGKILTRTFLTTLDYSAKTIDRVCYLVGHHHTPASVDGIDYQILLEADFLVNAEELTSKDAISTFRDKVFKTETGTRLLNSIYLSGE